MNAPAVTVLSPPKSNTATAGFVSAPPPSPAAEGVVLYINAPLVVNVTPDQVTSAKSIWAMPELASTEAEVTPLFVRVAPPAVYPAEDTSLVAAYAAVVASKDAEDVNKAILNVSPVEALKSCAASRNSALNDVHNACVIAMVYSSNSSDCSIIGSSGVSTFSGSVITMLTFPSAIVHPVLMILALWVVLLGKCPYGLYLRLTASAEISPHRTGFYKP